MTIQDFVLYLNDHGLFRVSSCRAWALFVFCFFVCFFCCYKTRKSLLRLLLWARSKTLGSISTQAVALPVVLPKVHHRPEPLYVPTAVNTLQVDGLGRIFGLKKALHKCILSHQIAFRDPPRLIPLSTNTQGRVRERGRGKRKKKEQLAIQLHQ